MATTTLKKITNRAKAIRRAHPFRSWKQCIKESGREYRAGKIGKVDNHQTGKSNRKADKERKAKPPGKRKSASGSIYYERRKNRSDKPGSLSGAKSLIRRSLKTKLSRLLLMHALAVNKRNKKNIAKQIREAKAELKKYSK